MTACRYLFDPFIAPVPFEFVLTAATEELPATYFTVPRGSIMWHSGPSPVDDLDRIGIMTIDRDTGVSYVAYIEPVVAPTAAAAVSAQRVLRDLAAAGSPPPRPDLLARQPRDEPLRPAGPGGIGGGGGFQGDPDAKPDPGDGGPPPPPPDPFAPIRVIGRWMRADAVIDQLEVVP